MTAPVLGTPLARELLDARVIANLASFRADGTIHLVAMWFTWDGTHVRFPTNSGSAKAKNLRSDPRATVMIDDSRGGFDVAGITITGRVELVEGAEARDLNRVVHLRYITAEGLAFPEVGGLLENDDVTLRLVPEKASTWDMRPLPGAALLRRTSAFEPLAPTLTRERSDECSQRLVEGSG